jgi:hypothetical protein
MACLNLTVDIDLEPRRAFELFTDLNKAAERISGIEKLEVLTDGPIGLGTRFSETRMMFKKECTETMEITEFEHGKRYAVGCESCGCAYNSIFNFKPKGAGTEVELEVTGRPISFFAKVMSPLTALMFGSMMKKCIGKDMTDLQAAAKGL